MSQATDLQLSNQPAVSFRGELNQIILALASRHKGPSAPPYAMEGMEWLDDSASPWVVKEYANGAWITTGLVDPANGYCQLINQAPANRLTGLPTVRQIQNGAVEYKITGGEGGTYIVDMGEGLRPENYVEGMEFKIRFHSPNAGAPTVNFTGSNGSGLGEKAVKLPNGATPPTNTLNGQATIRYDGNAFILVSGVAAYASRLNRAYAENTDGGTFQNVIPADNSIPQITEGVEIVSASFKPTSATSRVRVTFSSIVSSDVAGRNIQGAIFDGDADALAARIVRIPAAQGAHEMLITKEYVPGSDAQRTYSARLGIDASLGYTGSFNGASGGGNFIPIFGGEQIATLIVEEVGA